MEVFSHRIDGSIAQDQSLLPTLATDGGKNVFSTQNKYNSYDKKKIVGVTKAATMTSRGWEGVGRATCVCRGDVSAWNGCWDECGVGNGRVRGLGACEKLSRVPSSPTRSFARL